MANLRFRNMVASQSGTLVIMPARNGPTVPESRSRGWDRWKEGMMVMDSSPAKKVEAASEREMERGVLPKNEMEEEDDVVLPLPLAVVMAKK